MKVIAAIALYSQWQDNLVGLFQQASHGKRLLRLDCQEDLKYCAQTDILDVPSSGTRRSQRQK